MVGVVEVALFGFLLVIALAIVVDRELFSAAMLLGIFSLVSASLFTVLDAVDVAFTEAAVGAGISTILMLGTLSMTQATEVRTRPPLVPVLIVLATGAALVWATLDMPAFGDPNAPIHLHVAPSYLRESGEAIGIPNVVTSILASYRGYDTLGELFVITTAGIGVMLLLGRGTREA